MMPVGPILLVLLLILIYFGFLDRFLATLGISGRAALFLTAMLLLGSWVEVRPVPGLTLNLGAAILSAVVGLYLLGGAASAGPEAVRAGLAALVTGGVLLFLGRVFPPWAPTELNLFYLDAQYLYGLAAGAAAFATAGGPRPAFAAAVFGVLLADLVQYSRMAGAPQPALLHLGGGGFYLTTIVAGVVAMTLSAWFRESARSST